MLEITFAFIARACGGGLGMQELRATIDHGIKNKYLRFLASSLISRAPEIAFGLVIAILSPYNFYLVWLFATIAMELGHGNVYRMTGVDGLYVDRPQSIEKPIRPIFQYFGGNITKPIYSWLIMGIKGLLIAAPLGPIPALANAIAWPLAYHIGHRIEKNPALAEYLSGLFLITIATLT